MLALWVLNSVHLAYLAYRVSTQNHQSALATISDLILLLAVPVGSVFRGFFQNFKQARTTAFERIEDYAEYETAPPGWGWTVLVFGTSLFWGFPCSCAHKNYRMCLGNMHAILQVDMCLIPQQIVLAILKARHRISDDLNWTLQGYGVSAGLLFLSDLMTYFRKEPTESGISQEDLNRTAGMTSSQVLVWNIISKIFSLLRCSVALCTFASLTTSKICFNSKVWLLVA